MRVIKIKNLQTVSDTYLGQVIAAGEYYTIQSESERESFDFDSKVQEHLAQNKLCVNDGNSDLSYTDGLKWLREERIEARTVNCKAGRRLHDRYITFTTAKQDEYDNTDWQEVDYGDVTYIMKDINGTTTTVDADAKETWIDWEPTYDYEIMGGTFYIPTTLDGNNDDAWEVHVVAIPDVPVSSGGTIHFIANPRIKWMKGKTFGIDASLNPAELLYDSTYHTNKIRLIIKHPVGAQSELQFNLKLYK